MTLAAEKEIAHMGETHVMQDHDYDLVVELTRRLEGMWRYDQRIANASGQADLQTFWRDLKKQDLANIQRLRDLVCRQVKAGCF